MSNMRLYKVDDYEWWAGPNLGAVLAQKQSEQGLLDDELIDGMYLPRRVEREEMEKLTFHRDSLDGGGTCSFAEEWDRRMQETDFANRPSFFASTEF